VWLLLALVAGVLLVAKDKLEELFDQNDPVEVVHWLVGKLTNRFGEDEAMDLVQEAITDSLPGSTKPWSLGGENTYAVHLVYGVTNIRRNLVRRMGRKVLPDPEDDAPNALRSRLPDPEKVALRNDRHRRLYKAALAHFAESPTVMPVLERMFQGEWTSDAEHAEKTGLTAEQVQKARKRVGEFVHEWADREDSAVEEPEKRQA
jgi:hypothetical protein